MKFLKQLIILAVIFILVYYISRYLIRIIIYPVKYKEIVMTESKNSGVDPYLIFAVIKQESRFDKNAVSKKNAKGLMQIMDNTAIEIIKNNSTSFTSVNYDIFDPKTNISIGTKYLKQLLDRYEGNVTMAIASYNAGLGNVDKWKLDSNIFVSGSILVEKIPFEETRNYTNTVMKYYNGYKRSYEK